LGGTPRSLFKIHGGKTFPKSLMKKRESPLRGKKEREGILEITGEESSRGPHIEEGTVREQEETVLDSSGSGKKWRSGLEGEEEYHW